jgi:hypothetical protein
MALVVVVRAKNGKPQNKMRATGIPEEWLL